MFVKLTTHLWCQLLTHGNVEKYMLTSQPSFPSPHPGLLPSAYVGCLEPVGWNGGIKHWDGILERLKSHKCWQYHLPLSRHNLTSCANCTKVICSTSLVSCFLFVYECMNYYCGDQNPCQWSLTSIAHNCHMWYIRVYHIVCCW